MKESYIMFTLRNFVNKTLLEKAFASSIEARKPERKTISLVSFAAPSENQAAPVKDLKQMWRELFQQEPPPFQSSIP